jgi:uncharacterized protein
VKILAVSDETLPALYSPAVKERYPGVDLLIGCGDLPYYYLDYLTSALEAPMVYVLGNHDHGPQYTSNGEVLTEVRGGVNLHGRVLLEQGLLLAGLEGSMRYRPNGSLMYTETEMRREVLRLLPGLWWWKMRHGRVLDILITHSPPQDIHDRADLPHRGFRIFRTLLERFQPRYMLHGHIHLFQRGSQVTQYQQTTIINVYPLHLLMFTPDS